MFWLWRSIGSQMRFVDEFLISLWASVFISFDEPVWLLTNQFVLKWSKVNSKTMANQTNHNFKVVLLGEGCVGKTSLVLRYIEDKFNANHISTVQVIYLYFDSSHERGLNTSDTYWFHSCFVSSSSQYFPLTRNILCTINHYIEYLFFQVFICAFGYFNCFPRKTMWIHTSIKIHTKFNSELKFISGVILCISVWRLFKIDTNY